MTPVSNVQFDQDIAQFLLREGWAELPIDVTDQAYVEASPIPPSQKSRGVVHNGALLRIGSRCGEFCYVVSGSEDIDRK
jgi:hypothetical protein